MATYKGGLGRGIDALLAENDTSQNGVSMLRLANIEPNRAQVRKKFDPESIAELAASIKEHGLIQPIVVRRKQNGFYEIIAGERRWRACKAAGLSEVPVIVKDLDDRSASLVALVENLQREDLDPVEEARGYESLINEYGMNQENVAFSVGKSRPSVANKLRILALPAKLLEDLRAGKLSFGHARTLLPLAEKLTEKELCEFALAVENEEISVRETERRVKRLLERQGAETPSVSARKVRSSYYGRLESRASSRLGRKLAINEGAYGKGKVVIAYSSAKDLEVLLKQLCGNNFFEDIGE
ncbi:MAG: ParB/RepB/Spo0J family partition protein [Clostridia bacterium]|nr:ParB/RepB/Spo0J family partition protein [Clostridia bacterium]